MSSAPVVVVTGASRGIGRHLADAFEQAGYAVERGSSAVADVTDRVAVERWVGEVLGRHGRIDVLVNNAGVIDTEVPIHEADPEEWWRTMEVNVRGPFLVTHAVLPHMVAAGSGRVINVNSGAGVRPGAVASAYNASKTALARLTGSTDLAGRDHGVFAFDLAPGVVRTDMTEAMVAHVSRTEWTDPGEVTALALALAAGEHDVWSGRMVRAGVDTPASLRDRAAGGLDAADRTITLVPWGDDDPLG
ncbi:SDR family oxidoreductase [Phycicoccus sp. Root563]|uniref:SDR family oxidoreductase n=1 Tax=Phycicoccus sp. Root563 TaxID=1736562 RepID=UPI0007039364|nr:SDR family NAD(P)-dependent oxidoreductase [Phycicoccus sp. Root563]KQZ87722.1 3-oxoacyl-ACP reductase [Phycicoccus sp. Root563]